METNSTSNFESDPNLNDTPDADEKKSKLNDSNVAYFDCKNCQNTFTIHGDQENFDPNAETDICKDCKAKQLFQSVLSEESIESSRRRSKSIQSPHPPATAAAAAAADFDETEMSPLTSNPGDVQSEPRDARNEPRSSNPRDLYFPPSPYKLGESHTFAIQLKPPKTNSSNYSVMNLYESNGVLDPEFESLVKESNDKRIEKFYAGVDVIYKPTNRNVCSCVPLLCPARVYYFSSDEIRDKLTEDVIVGILLDRHGSPYPLMAVFDAFGNYKNLVKGRYVISTYFNRFQPHSVVNDFTAEQTKDISLQLCPFLKIKTAFQEMEGILDVINLIFLCP
jgi:hypothetical protein